MVMARRWARLHHGAGIADPTRCQYQWALSKARREDDVLVPAPFPVARSALNRKRLLLASQFRGLQVV